MVRRISPSEVWEMLTTAANQHGYAKAEVDAMWADGTLEEPELQDLWLIWGAVGGSDDDT